MTKRSISYFAFLLLLFILAISDAVQASTPKICEKPSKTWSGKCDDAKCDKKCISWEGATHGACHMREAKKSCFCYFECKKKPPPKDKKPPPKDKSPPPPKDGSPPPPADGGSPPPPADGSSPPPADGGSSPPPKDGSPPPPKDGPPPPPKDEKSPPPPKHEKPLSRKSKIKAKS